MSSFEQEVSHALLLNDGNPSLILKALLDENDVKADLYLVRSPYARPTPLPVGDFFSYGLVLVRTESANGDVSWLYPNGPDAMFGAFNGAMREQRAVCISCLEPAEDVVSLTQEPKDWTDTEVKSQLSKTGDLTGTVHVTVHGATAVQIRKGLRARPDETSRSKFVDSLLAATIPGASVIEYKIQNEGNPDVLLKFQMSFVRPKYATATGNGVFQIETRIFHQSLASAFASLPKRTVPLMLGFRSTDRYAMQIEFPFDTVEIASATGDRTFKSPFGSVRRQVNLKDKTLRIDLQVNLHIQRVKPADYSEFQEWAVEVEQSSGVLARMQ